MHILRFYIVTLVCPPFMLLLQFTVLENTENLLCVLQKKMNVAHLLNGRPHLCAESNPNWFVGGSFQTTATTKTTTFHKYISHQLLSICMNIRQRQTHTHTCQFAIVVADRECNNDNWLRIKHSNVHQLLLCHQYNEHNYTRITYSSFLLSCLLFCGDFWCRCCCCWCCWYYCHCLDRFNPNPSHCCC